MSPLSGAQFVLILLTAVIVMELLARRVGLPPAAAFIVAGGSLAQIPGAPEVTMDPNLILSLLLPPLLFSGAYFTGWRDFRSELRSILHLAVGAVAFTTLVVGVVAHLVFDGLPWFACFALGAIVSPPDAVAAKAVLKRLHLPRRLVLVLEGESLLNDASGIELYRIAVAAGLTGVFEAADATLGFTTLALGGTALGVGLGLGASRILRRLQDPKLHVSVLLLVAWVSYSAGEAAGVSGVLATVTSGFVIGWRQHREVGAVARLESAVVWSVLGFFLESVVFLLIGLSLRGVLERLGEESGGATAFATGIMAIIAAVILSRFAWIAAMAYAVPAALPRPWRTDPYPPIGVTVVMGWAGMRGVVSLAAALALPVAFPGRDIILATTFAVIATTVLIQGPTLGPLARSLRLDGYARPRADVLPEGEVRLRLAAAQAEAARSSAARFIERGDRIAVLERYVARAEAAARDAESPEAGRTVRRDQAAVVLAAVQAGRGALLDLFATGAVSDRLLRKLENELDMEEAIAARAAAEGERA